ncbi:Zn-dependent protease with chaperone function [Curtobacterium sp. PhB130]|uniref:M56 family metallopeptidase n=1 Tax=unclassified Curtobacterium TaxID=257496 RepID=UPI000F4B418A|nr:MULTISPECIES: M56 family metallopeptidase [unclassified Curtobacterium]ROS74968.1 Zn-dependent protease with chaperone function [Curtobacterium sp. PhB130]TCK63582.1 Zn-dependent protease with chaperone function [Curtobacterium sp. PhB136]
MVVTGVVLIVLALAVVALAPRILTRSAWTIDRPRTALVSWSLAVVLGALGFVAGITLVVTANRPVTDPFALGDSPSHGLNIGVALIAVLAFVIAVRVRPGSEHRAVKEAMRSGAAPHREIDGTLVAVVEAEHALACAVPGRSGGVLVSSGLADRLRTDELEAVVAHERAHLHQRHAAVVAVAESIERAVPWIPGARAMARSTRVLVEFAADDAAARRIGRDAVRRAVLVADETSALAAIRASRLR